jgi:uroporphyrinogen-III synthase
MMRQPLAGLNIAVTRPREQAMQLAQRIAQAGGRATVFPLLEIGPAVDLQPLRALIARLHEFDIAIFVSPNAVNYGMEAIVSAGKLGLLVQPKSLFTDRTQASEVDALLDHHGQPHATLRVATIGQGGFRALRGYGIEDVIAPQGDSDSEALLRLLELQPIEGLRVIIFRGNGGREFLGEALRARGASVEYATCYQRSRSQQNVATLLATNLDVVVVTSSEALGHLVDMLDEASKKRFFAVTLFVPYARIAETAYKLGWDRVVLTKEGDDGLMSDLLAWTKKNILNNSGIKS